MPRRKETTIPFMKNFRKKKKDLVYSKQSTKTQNPSGKGYVECKFCSKKIYSFDTTKLYYHILFEHWLEEFVEPREATEVHVNCKLCKKKIVYFETEGHVKFVFRMEDHLFREHRLIDFFDNHLVDQTTEVVEFICPSANCKPKHKYGIGYAWCTKYHYDRGDVKLICPHCLTFMIPKEEYERLK